MIAAKATVRSDYGPNPNGVKLYTAGTHRRRFKWQRRHSHLSARNFGPLIRNMQGREDAEALVQSTDRYIARSSALFAEVQPDRSRPRGASRGCSRAAMRFRGGPSWQTRASIGIRSV